MFTGIIEETSEVTAVKSANEGSRIKIEPSGVCSGLDPGDSIAVSGVCLTIEQIKENYIELFFSEETLAKSWFNQLSVGAKLNIETPLTPSDPIGGHIVQGHIEDTSEIVNIEDLGSGWSFKFSKPKNLDNYIVTKGYIAIEGVSFTVVEEDLDFFSVNVVPKTYQRTNLFTKSVGDKVNIETDVTARYMEKMTKS